MTVLGDSIASCTGFFKFKYREDNLIACFFITQTPSILTVNKNVLQVLRVR